MDYNEKRFTVAELPEYLKQARRLLDEQERQDIVQYLAAHPRAGDLMVGTGGVRKLRWGRQSTGKSGGVSVIYYVHSELMPLYLLTIFGKNERANLSLAERNELSQLVGLLIQQWLDD
jgi:mRNA-degrading endonuclease RelE of RelBE toxin-antitoxin system